MDSYIYCFNRRVQMLMNGKKLKCYEIVKFLFCSMLSIPLIRDFHQTYSWLSLSACACFSGCTFFLLSFSYAMADESMRWKYKMIQEWIARWLLAWTDFFPFATPSFFTFFFYALWEWLFLSFFSVAVSTVAVVLLHIACKKNSEPEINVHENLFGHVERFALHN